MRRRSLKKEKEEEEGEGKRHPARQWMAEGKCYSSAQSSQIHQLHLLISNHQVFRKAAFPRRGWDRVNRCAEPRSENGGRRGFTLTSKGDTSVPADGAQASAAARREIDDEANDAVHYLVH
ncbi:hypothetical protein EYF80_000192 [Liparis tanakae]|uniref:Uncharacterized protein n=1 Tax=Liparis tanakae TaxID=230148 RepID=A0A4Z2JH06_9TELE|nr:hypothetical protein EYF80_000192 [Liparis tanakae]